MRALEFGLNYQLSIINCQLSVWHHHGTNMIDWIMDTTQGENAIWQSVNHTKLNSIGFETSVQCTMHHAQCTISYSFISQDKEQEPGIVSQYALEYLRHKLVANLRLPLTDRLSLHVVAYPTESIEHIVD